MSYIRHKDWLGSSRLATTWAHGVYSKEAYAPFGETYNEAGTPDRSFTGQDQDVATGPGGTGVYDYLFRKYDPSAGRWLSPDPKGWGATSKADPQSFNRYAYVENNPMTSVDPDGEACLTLANGGKQVSVDNSYDGPAAGCSGQFVQGFVGDGGMGFGEAISQTNYVFNPNTQLWQMAQQQNGSSGGTGFWSHVGNLLHLHSWNYGMRESVTMTIEPGSESEPNPYVAVGTDALGVAGAATGHPGLGRVGAAISVTNDPSVPNLVMTGMSFVPVVGEAVGAVTAVQDVGLLAGKWITNNVMAPMINAIPGNTMDNGNGISIPTPEKACEDSGMC